MQLQLGQRSFQFKFSIGFSFLCLFFVGLFLILGGWQLQRYHYKKDLLLAYQQRQLSTPKTLAEITEPNAFPFQPVTVKGNYINSLTMLVQNQFYKDQLGFEVLTPLHITDDVPLLLIDRGWIPASSGTPVIADVLEPQDIVGVIKLLNEYQFTLGENILKPNEMPLVMQKMDIDEISRLTGRSFYPFILRLNESAPHGFVRHWVITSVMPERHMGYAIQWVVMALVLLVAYLAYCFERVVPLEQASASRSMSPKVRLTALLSLFILPVFISAVLYYYHDWFQLKLMNRGVLVTPPIGMQYLSQPLPLGARKQWKMVYVQGSTCDEQCEHIVYQLHQVQKALGKDSERVNILKIPEVHTALSSAFAGRGENNFDVHNKIYLIDPIGNLFMYYPSGTDPMNILKDLQRVLEVSQIG